MNMMVKAGFASKKKYPRRVDGGTCNDAGTCIIKDVAEDNLVGSHLKRIYCSRRRYEIPVKVVIDLCTMTSTYMCEASMLAALFVASLYALLYRPVSTVRVNVFV